MRWSRAGVAAAGAEQRLGHLLLVGLVSSKIVKLNVGNLPLPFQEPVCTLAALFVRTLYAQVSLDRAE